MKERKVDFDELQMLLNMRLKQSEIAHPPTQRMGGEPPSNQQDHSETEDACS